jgi:hypothetical protein
MYKEWMNLQETGTYEEVRREPWMTVIPTMWVINRSADDHGKEDGKLKARLVVRGDQDKNEEEVPCDSPTVDRTTVKMMIAIAANQGWGLRSIDISAAFLQGREMDREVYVQPPPEIATPGTVWKLKKGLYGLKEAARLWYDEILAELVRRGGHKLVGDPGCVIFHVNGTFIGFVIVHVDDIIISGNPEFVIEMVKHIKARFRVSKDQIEKFIYTGMAIRTDKAKRLFLNQNQYLEELANVPADAETGKEDGLRTVLRAAVGRLLYLNLTRPDLAFRTNFLSRVSPSSDLREKIKEARELTSEAKRSPLEIKYGKLGQLEKLSLEVYSDASFGGIDKGLKSTEGHIILLRGDSDKCAPISWRSKLIARVCKSAKSAETIALENVMDTAIGIGRQLRQIQTGIVDKQPADIHAFTDSASLVESIRSTKQVDEGNMRVSIHRIQDHLNHKDVKSVGWVPTHMMLADPLTKKKADTSALTGMLSSGIGKRYRGEKEGESE